MTLPAADELIKEINLQDSQYFKKFVYEVHKNGSSPFYAAKMASYAINYKQIAEFLSLDGGQEPINLSKYESITSESSIEEDTGHRVTSMSSMD